MKPERPGSPDRALHRSEVLFRAAFEDAPIGMAVLTLDGRFLKVNRALCELLGMAEEELCSLNWRDVTHPEDRSAQEVFEENAIQGRARVFHMEKRYVRSDGGWVWALLSRSLVTDDAGEPLYFISEILDITGRKRIEAALEAREEETRRILETAQEAFIGMDAEGRISDWNRHAETTFGWTREEALGRSLADTIIPERLRDAHWQGLHRFLETGHGPVLNSRVEVSALRRDGTEFPVELTIWAQEAGDAVRFNALVHDISERREVQAHLARQNEELRAADEMKSHFVAVTSHELRTPLTSVLGFASTLLRHWDRLPDDEKRRQIELIHGQAERLGTLVEELLTMSKIEAGALDVRLRPIDVRAAVDEALSAFEASAERLVVDAPAGLQVRADPHHLQQILTNYVANALQHGAPPVRVEARREDGWVEVLVRDRGPGVPPEFVPRLFEKFSQAPNADGGTGLGLSIVRGLARAQGGEAWYAPGDPGAAFGVRLPAAG